MSLPSDIGRLEPSASRIAAIDIIRGLALFGVLQVNLFSFSGQCYAEWSGGTYPGGPLSDILSLIRDVLINGKAMSSFSILFGVGLAIQMERAVTRGASFLRFALRRLGALALIGIAHALLIWNGDILLDYAIIGLMLLPLLRARVRTILLVAAGAFVLDTAFRQILVSLHTPDSFLFNYWRQQFGWLCPRADWAYGHGSWMEAARWRAWEWAYFGRSVHVISIFGCAPQFFLGLALWRSGILRDVAGSIHSVRRIFHGVFWAGLALTFLSIPLAAKMMTWRHGWREMVRAGVYELPLFLLALGYFAGMLLPLQRARWQRWLAPLAPMGRMALTNYLGQSLVCTWIFNGHGLGLYGKLTPAAFMLGGVALYGAQIAFSRWWLGRFRFGPAEWLWRSMTYGRLHPLRLQPLPEVEPCPEG